MPASAARPTDRDFRHNALAPAQIKPAPEFSAALETQFITGLGTIDERMLILLDIEKLMTSRDMQLVDRAAQQA